MYSDSYGGIAGGNKLYRSETSMQQGYVYTASQICDLLNSKASTRVIDVYFICFHGKTIMHSELCSLWSNQHCQHTLKLEPCSQAFSPSSYCKPLQINSLFCILLHRKLHGGQGRHESEYRLDLDTANKRQHYIFIFICLHILYTSQLSAESCTHKGRLFWGSQVYKVVDGHALYV